MNKADQQALNDIAWAEVTHAYGPAVDAPDMLRQLMEGGDDLEEATEFLFGVLTHQGTLYSATLPVLRFCVRVLDQLSVEATEQVVAWIQFVGSLTRTSPEAPYAAELRAEAISVVEALLALDAEEGGEYYTRALGAWCCDAENGLAYRVRTRLQECPVDGGTLAALGTWGGDLSAYLTSDDLGVRAAAAFHDRSNAGTTALIEVLADPDIEDVWLEIEPEGRLDDVADELLTRDLGAISETERAQLESLAVLYASTNFMPWEHFLQLIDVGNGNGVLMRMQPNGSCMPWWTMTSCGKPRTQPPLLPRRDCQETGRNCGRWWERPVCDVGWAVSIAYSTLPKRCALTKLAATFTWVRQLRGVVKHVAPSAQHVVGHLSQLKYHR